jgi:hypothetical protein
VFKIDRSLTLPVLKDLSALERINRAQIEQAREVLQSRRTFAHKLRVGEGTWVQAVAVVALDPGGKCRVERGREQHPLMDAPSLRRSKNHAQAHGRPGRLPLFMLWRISTK